MNRLLSSACLVAVLMVMGCGDKHNPVSQSPENQLQNQTPVPAHVYSCLFLTADQYRIIPVAVLPRWLLKTAAAPTMSLDCPPVGDQGQQGSCTAWGTAYAARGIQWHYKTGGTWSTAVNIFSPAYVYNQTKAGRDCNSGAYVPDPLKLLQSQGVCRWDIMPYTDRNCSTLPNSSQKADAANYKIASYSRVGITSDSIKSFILANRPVVVAGPVNIDFESLASGAVLTTFRGKSLGGHCYCVVGYDDTKSAFKFLNSWGTGWASAGYGFIGYNYVKQWWGEAYVENEPVTAPPGQALNPNPVNGATGASTAPTLSWTAGTGAASHDVYFGTVNPPPLKGNQSTASYVPGTLGANTTYYWKIDERNSAGLTAGLVWSFTTGASVPQYTVTASATNGRVVLNPSGGTYNSGTVVTLTATPAAGYAFSGWSGDLSGTTNPATITMNANKSVTANFTPVPVTYEAENLARTASSVGSNVSTGDARNSNSAYVQLSGTPATGAWLEFTLPDLAAGTYNIAMYFKANTNRGICQGSVDGANLGAACDEYRSAVTYQVMFNLGNKVFAAAGSHKIRFTTTGKNTASSGYTMTIDKFVLTKQ